MFVANRHVVLAASVCGRASRPARVQQGGAVPALAYDVQTRGPVPIPHLKAILAAETIKLPDRKGLTVHATHTRTGIASADFSRIRNADLGRFTVDRLMSILNSPRHSIPVQ